MAATTSRGLTQAFQPKAAQCGKNKLPAGAVLNPETFAYTVLDSGHIVQYRKPSDKRLGEAKTVMVKFPTAEEMERYQQGTQGQTWAGLASLGSQAPQGFVPVQTDAVLEVCPYLCIICSEDVPAAVQLLVEIEDKFSGVRCEIMSPEQFEDAEWEQDFEFDMFYGDKKSEKAVKIAKRCRAQKIATQFWDWRTNGPIDIGPFAQTLEWAENARTWAQQE